MTIQVVCQNPKCQKSFYASPTRLARGHGKYCSYPCRSTRHPSVEERFWAKVKKTDNCWVWTGKKHEDGYGRFVTSHAPLVQWLTHRYVWTLIYGPIPDALLVCHRCDNPPCVNPEHLFLGTQKDNMEDCAKKGRIKRGMLHGEDHPAAKLREEEVLQIFFYKGIRKQRDVAKEFHCCQQLVSLIWQKKIWKHIFYPIVSPG